MPTVRKSALVPHPAAEMFALVDDVEHYPAFLPWCAATEVHARDDTCTVATIHIDYLGLRQSFTTANDKVAPVEMKMRLQEGPFSALNGVWRFEPLSDTACKVLLTLDYAFSNPLLEKAVGPVFGGIAATLVDRFVARAEALHGS